MKTGNNIHPPPPPQHHQFISYLFYLGKKERIKKIKVEYETSDKGEYLGIKELIIENTPTGQC
jgi:hypothetical protein